MKRASQRGLDYSSDPLAKTTGPFDDSASPEVLERLPTVLIIESDPILRNLLRDILSRNQYLVLDAVNTNEAVSLLHAMPNQEMDLVIANAGADGAAILKDMVLPLRPSLKILFTMPPNDGFRTGDLAAFEGIPVLYEPFTELRLLEQIAALLQPRMQ